MGLKLCASLLFWKLLVVSNVIIAASKMVPYYLGNTLIILDSFDSNLPTRHRPLSHDNSEGTYVQNFEGKLDGMKNNDNLDNNHIMSVKIFSDTLSTTNDDGDDGSISKNYIQAFNRDSLTPTITINDKNDNIVVNSDTKNSDNISFNGIIEFINKPFGINSAENKDSKSNTKTTFIDSAENSNYSKSNIKTAEIEPDDSILSSKEDIQIMDRANIKNVNPNSNFIIVDGFKINNNSSTDIETTNARPENSIPNLKVNIKNNSDKNSNFTMINAFDTIRILNNPTSNTKIAEKVNKDLESSFKTVDLGTNEVKQVTTKLIKASENSVEEDNKNSKSHNKHKDTNEEEVVIDSIANNFINKNNGVNKISKSRSENDVDIKKIVNQGKEYEQSSKIKSIKSTEEENTAELLGNIEKTLNNYFKTDSEQTKTEILYGKLQKILNFLKEEGTSISSRNFNYFKELPILNSVKSHRTTRDIGSNGFLSKKEAENQLSQSNFKNQMRQKKDSSIESLELNALSYIVSTRDSEEDSMENLYNERILFETNDDDDDDVDTDDSEMNEMENLNSSIEHSGFPSRKVDDGTQLPIRVDDYIDYDIDYYDYYDYSNPRQDTGTDNLTIVDEFINSNLNEFGNYTEIDEFGNYLEIIDNANYTEVDEYDINNSTEIAVNVTGVEEIENLELLLSKKTCRCGIPISKTKIKRIVKGQDTSINLYPWIVQIAERRDGYVFCGGSIINDLYILTAAHCTVGYHPKELFVRMGHTNATNKVTGSKALIKSIIIHPKYRTRDGTKYDIALMRLRRPIKYTENVLPVCLSTLLDNDNKTGTIIGWGSKTEGTEGSTILQETDVNIMEADTCKASSGYKKHEIPKRVLCARGNGTDSCQGDSGGPLVIEEASQYYMAGITSWGIGCGLEEYPGVYTKVSLYIGWIKLKTKDALYCQPDGENQIRKISNKDS